MPSPRVLTLSLQFRVPEGLRANVRAKRIDAAIDRLVGAVQGLAPAVFPWADRITITSSWDYRWREHTETVILPATAENTVDEPATDAEETTLIDGVDTPS